MAYGQHLTDRRARKSNVRPAGFEKWKFCIQNIPKFGHWALHFHQSAPSNVPGIRLRFLTAPIRHLFSMN